ncbi:hypothetical protein H1C71_005982 [Ictidomys tridecemlineatus]|nr:hypothetical protein H1C71_005982 [Ictidomys tridecemlineatus]
MVCWSREDGAPGIHHHPPFPETAIAEQLQAWKWNRSPIDWIYAAVRTVWTEASKCVLANTTVDWAHAYTRAANTSACWVCTEVPGSSAAGLPSKSRLSLDS